MMLPLDFGRLRVGMIVAVEVEDLEADEVLDVEVTEEVVVQ